MNRNLRNAIFSVLEYVSYPATMLMVAPATLRGLGAPAFGLWMICGAVISVGGMIASGFGDANLRNVAKASAANNSDNLRDSVRSLMTLNLVLGMGLALLVVVLARAAAHRMAAAHPAMEHQSAVCLRLAALGIVARAINSVAVSTQRALEHFHTAATVHIASHVLALLTAAALVVSGRSVVPVVLSMVLFTIGGAAAQCWVTMRKCGAAVLLPHRNPRAIAELFRDGKFLWLQTTSAVLLDRADRVLIGLLLGAAAVTPYAIATQLVQPLAGLTGAALSFLFPLLSRKTVAVPASELRRSIWRSFSLNCLLVALPAVMLVLFGRNLLVIWAGVSVASQAAPLILPLVSAAALTGLSVTGIYALQALGRFRAMAVLSVASRLFLLPVLFLFVKHWGTMGLASARVIAGAALLLVYPLLARSLSIPQASQGAFGAGVTRTREVAL